MEKCKWSFKIFGLYFQKTEKGVFQILAKKEGQWVTIYSRKRQALSERKIMDIAKAVHRQIYGDAPVVGDAIDPITIAKTIKTLL